jgi:cyclase
MLKKRVIFVLLFDRGYFMLSRNFRLQRVGTLEWLVNNYDFALTASYIDELVLLNVQRDSLISSDFCTHLRELSDICFAPITAGGGVTDLDSAALLLGNGADKVLINSIAVQRPNLVDELAEVYGRQCVVLGVDLKRVNGELRAHTNHGSSLVDAPLLDHFSFLRDLPVGEWFVTSIDRDGTGQGFDSDVLDVLPQGLPNPVILSGGASKPSHFLSVLGDERVNALATAHLFNFIGDGLSLTRKTLLDAGFSLPHWNPEEISDMRGALSAS